MIIALTGTPGTGKTSICALLEQHYRIIDLNALIIGEGLHAGKDEQRGSFEADMEALQARVDELVADRTATVIIEGHLSHLLTGIDGLIVLRTRPCVLAQRLENRGYPPQKVQENMEAEALDVILVEAVERYERVYELETTMTIPEDAVRGAISMIQWLESGDHEQLRGFLPGRFDWSEEVFG
ncbi:MAG: adenylate kinase family protein [ANME-2 cluster archaeon]|nr:adenylate kinase family protein [ANME-2 cluster archaeon]